MNKKTILRAFIFFVFGVCSVLSGASAGIKMTEAIRARLAMKNEPALLLCHQGLRACIDGGDYAAVMDVLLSSDTKTFKRIMRQGIESGSDLVQFVLVNYQQGRHCVFNRLMPENGRALNRKARRDLMFRWVICNQLIAYFDNVDYEQPGKRCVPVALDIEILPPAGGGNPVMTLREIIERRPVHLEQRFKIFESHVNRSLPHQRKASSPQYPQQPVPTALRQQRGSRVLVSPLDQSLYQQPLNYVQSRSLNFLFDMNVFKRDEAARVAGLIRDGVTPALVLAYGPIKYSDVALSCAASALGTTMQAVHDLVLKLLHLWATVPGQANLLLGNHEEFYLELQRDGMSIIFDNAECEKCNCMFNRIVEVTRTFAELNRFPVNVRMAIESMQGGGRLVMVV